MNRKGILSAALTAVILTTTGIGFDKPVHGEPSSGSVKTTRAPKWKRKRRRTAEKSRRANRRKR